uniref:Uncharacterized protein n=1 Tax=Magallana gigas TaxID=29159 RepID=A0A8W8M9K7_MAGGI
MQFHVIYLLAVFLVSGYFQNDVNAYAAKHKKNVLALKKSAVLIRHHQQKHRLDSMTSSAGFSNMNPKISFPRRGRKRVPLGSVVQLNLKQKVPPAITKRASKLKGSMKNRKISESILKRQSFAKSNKKKTPFVSTRARTSVNPRLKTFLPLLRRRPSTNSRRRVIPISKSTQRQKMTEAQLLTSIKPSYQNVLNLIGPGCSINDVS